jgi:hypothetical protein
MTQNSLGRSKGTADIVFLLDCTGSMQPCLSALAANVGRLLDTMVNPGANAAAVVTDWRAKVIGYRDAIADGDRWWIESPFTTDPERVRADLAALEPQGGGDEPESLLDALWRLSRMPATEREVAPEPHAWRHRHEAVRCVVVFTDASTHMATAIPEASGATSEDVIREILNAKLRLFLFCPEAGCYHLLQSIDGVEMDFVGSLSDARTRMKAFSENHDNFRKVMEGLAKSISVTSVAIPL